MVFANEKGRSLRSSVDFRKLDVVKVRNYYVLRSMDESIDFPRETRSSVDFRKLDVAKVRDYYVLRSMDKSIDFPREARTFSTLGGSSESWEIENDQRYRLKIAFTTHHGLFQFVRIPLDLINPLELF